VAAAIPVNRLELGDHACVTFSDAEERLDILAAFVSAGLECDDKVICFTDATGIEDDLRERDVVVAERQLCVVPTKQFWGDDAGPDAVAMVKRLAGEMARAQVEGRRGLRITADMCWAARPQANAEQLLAFESEVGKLFAEGKLTAICEYDRETFDPVTLAYATRVHPRTVAATVYYEDPTLRICRQHVPPGVRVAGELDYTRADVLSDALAEAVRLDHDVHLNLSHLRFIDAGAAAVILRAAANLPASRRMVVVCTTPIDRTLAVAGAAQVTQLTIMVRRDGR
jgi:anti-anti-sigma factor